jgi:hypothetical protein
MIDQDADVIRLRRADAFSRSLFISLQAYCGRLARTAVRLPSSTRGNISAEVPGLRLSGHEP